ncbi:DUF1214 domain-containing protein [Roseibium aggregatum]|uniref:DUF1214 domain-containing protein n=1 Tax=Roseibium aggregatum TaxID=187304 RepID=A0A939J366_9HYPH|nr:DUF1254 domain-containing protein [Roseibium aggregatum]MBN9669825.1 DUF1214 domain-containing protein [Roseibium aggregatum]
MRFFLTFVFSLAASTAAAVEPVTLDTIVRAETDTAFRTTLDQAGGAFNTFLHIRELTPVDAQTVIRSNRDTIYSAVLLDLSEPVTVTIPDAGGRYISFQVINQDHYMFVLKEPGEHVLTQDKVGSRFAQILVRTFVDPNDEKDIAAVHAIQDEMKAVGGGAGPFVAPNWDQEQLQSARDAINQIAILGFSSVDAFGSREETRPVDHLVGAIAGWGGLPKSEAYYEAKGVGDASGTPYTVTVKDVPVDAFWSITVYNADGFLEPNELNAYSYNNVTAKPNGDGSYTVNFGGCGDDRVNCLPVPEGWNYAVRMYRPRAEILDGSWVFPEPVPAQ